MINLATASYFEYPSNFSNGTIVDGLSGVIKYMQYSTDYMFGWMLLLSLGLIMFLVLKGNGYPASKSFSATGFAMLLISVLLMMMGIVSFLMVMIIVIVLIVMALIARHESSMGL